MVNLADRRQVGQMEFMRGRKGDGRSDRTDQPGNGAGLKTHGGETGERQRDEGEGKEEEEGD